VNGFPAERIPHATESDAYLKKEKQRFIKAIMAGQDAALDSDSDDSLPPSSKTKIPYASSPSVQKKKVYGTTTASVRHLNKA
jgi:hypothetical protein